MRSPLRLLIIKPERDDDKKTLNEIIHKGHVTPSYSFRGKRTNLNNNLAESVTGKENKRELRYKYINRRFHTQRSLFIHSAVAATFAA